MSNPVKAIGHLTEYELKALKEGTLLKSEVLTFSEHISDCGLCAERFTACLEEDELMEVPKGFRENVVHKLQPEKDDRRQLLFYSIRVAVAACITLIFIFSGALNFISGMDNRIMKQDIRGLYVADTVNAGLQNFSEKLLNLEVFASESEKK